MGYLAASNHRSQTDRPFFFQQQVLVLAMGPLWLKNPLYVTFLGCQQKDSGPQKVHPPQGG